jgi:predicted RNA-binding Zn ribbon-like protein
MVVSLGVFLTRSAVSRDLIPDGLPHHDVPRPAALVRDFVNTVDHELHTDELATPAGLTDFLLRQGLLDAGEADEDQKQRALELRAGLHEALKLNHTAASSEPGSLDHMLDGLAVRLHWSGRGVVVVPADEGVGGALAGIGLAAHQALAGEVWWRLKICAFDECEWAYYDLSKNRSRSYCDYGCGNKIKTRAYRARRREAASARGG